MNHSQQPDEDNFIQRNTAEGEEEKKSKPEDIPQENVLPLNPASEEPEEAKNGNDDFVERNDED
ncbi:hypothetical protein [Siphonobacter sp. SORGH_AS_1065]|uniref:hypothetical protein n=1 Tax=Siphonobacter sp. SORGH_AS_1065 TaxID=3041795 RepID=UPI00278839E7|nr:hypothetical protein [Siphonobacter sp. SORGH_AS_1065]MDQ1087518.1 hypothetical protein [Siphonobacter sp. SORGH_AS_1065]